MVEKLCEVCSKVMRLRPSMANVHRFCSWACRRRGMKTISECKICHKKFSRPPTQKGPYCSKRCYGVAKTNPPPKTLFINIMGKTPSPSTKCWLWKGKKNTGGYGWIKYKGKHALAHRVSYLIFKGPIGNKTYICHTCDVPLCVNPAHLYEGTPQTNVDDRVARGRSYKGPHWWSKKRVL